ncbi:helix-turn-helix domain-containing protein [Lactiplantibacillus pentosus]|uniref:helix-turn-helix domain-containing protein n=1 Tax=Lactiplantibacillus pentosus TaxID=1589 RepID=UPI0013302353|nr:helix-turn-helix domain-containing protein [Lactiplantibacillus pentosus]
MNNEIGGYWSIIPSYIMERTDLKANEKLIYGIVSSLTSSKGYCWASNARIGKGIGVKADTASRCITNLVKAGFLARRIVRNENNEITDRYLTIVQPQTTDGGPTTSNSETGPIGSSSDSSTGNLSNRTPGQKRKERIKGPTTTPTNNEEDKIKHAVMNEHPLAFYQIAFGVSATGLLNSEINTLATQYGNQLVNYAFYLAATAGKSYQYAKVGLLDNWAKDGLTTIQQVADDRAKYQAKKQRHKPVRYGKPQSNVTPIDTHQTTLNDRIRSVFITNNGDVNAVIKQFAVDDITVTADQIRGVMDERA